MALSIDAALKFLRENGISFRPIQGDWQLQHLSLSSDELIRLCEMLQDKRTGWRLRHPVNAKPSRSA